MDFDQAAAYRLWYFDLAAENRLAVKIANAVWSIFSGLSANETATATEPEAAINAAKVW